MRTERLYLTDIVEAADAITRFLESTEREQFLQDELRQSAVLQKLTVIGEAASHISAETRSQHPEIEWRDIVSFRNFAIHEYFGVNWEVVWVTATLEAPVVRKQVAATLADDSAESSDKGE